MPMRYVGFILLWIGIGLGCTSPPPTEYTVQLTQPVWHDLDYRDYLRFLPDTVGLDSFSLLTLGYGGTFELMRLRAGDVQVGATRFRIGLVDADHDGRYHQADRTGLWLSAYGADTTNVEWSHANVTGVKARTFFQVDRHHFEISHFDSLGRFLRFRPVARTAGSAVARLNTRLPRIPVQDLQHQTVTLQPSAHQGRPLLVFVWSLGPDEGATLRSLDSLCRLLPNPPAVWSINMLDNADNLQRFLADHPLDIPIYRALPETCRAIPCQTRLPVGILVGKDGRVINYGLRGPTLLRALTTLSQTQ